VHLLHPCLLSIKLLVVNVYPSFMCGTQFGI